MSVVPISTGRSKEVPRTSKALIKRSLGSLFSHLGLQSKAETEEMGGGASIGSLSIVLGSSTVNTVNLFTSDRGILIAGHAVRVTGAPDSRRILSNITVCNYDTTHLQENPQRLG